MEKYTRYFKVTEGALIKAIKECREINKKADAEYVEILSKLGADKTYYVRGTRLVAMTFPEAPDSKVFKKNKNTKDGWYPKKNCKAGREIAKALESVKTMDQGDCLKVFDLSSGPRIISGGFGYCATLVVIPSEPMVAFVTVPWFDEDPEVIEQYKKDRDAGKSRRHDIDAILWKPAPEMTEIKEWEVKKAIQEWNDSLKADAA